MSRRTFLSGVGKMFTPDDMYQGTRLSAVEALFSGFTFAHDCRRDDHARDARGA